MNKESLKAVLQQFTERDLPRFSRRDMAIPMDSGKIVTLIGARRTGKTFLLFQLMSDLLNEGIDRRQILYLNFEDDRLYPIKTDELDLILKAHRELFPDAGKTRRYVFLDEIQNVEAWERFVRRIYDTENVSIFLTGSSSALLQKDLSSAMRGRSITFEVFPLSFSEFLGFKKIAYVPYSPDSEASVIHAFREYLDWGGFPEVVQAETALKPLILQEYASLMLHRDLVERYHLRNERLMHLLLKYCAEHTASLVSVNKLFHDFTSQGLKTGKATLYDYLAMLQDSFIVFSSPKYDPSSRRQMQAPMKMHLVDPGLSRVFRPYPEQDIGHRFESLIYLHVRRKHRDICYYRNGFELDLCWGAGISFVNVAWQIDTAETAAREAKAMDAGFGLWPGADGQLVYGSCERLPEKQQPHAVEGWKYLLS